MKTKIKGFLVHFKNHGAFYVLILNALVWTTLYQVAVPIGREFLSKSPIKTTYIAKEAKAEALQSTTPKQYMLNRIKEEGLSVAMAECILKNESGFNPSALGVNNNKTADLGYWQINSIHIKGKRITLTCATNYKCSTEWVIDKVKNEGNWSAWSTLSKCK